MQKDEHKHLFSCDESNHWLPAYIWLLYTKLANGRSAQKTHTVRTKQKTNTNPIAILVAVVSIILHFLQMFPPIIT